MGVRSSARLWVLFLPLAAALAIGLVALFWPSVDEVDSEMPLAPGTPSSPMLDGSEPSPLLELEGSSVESDARAAMTSAPRSSATRWSDHVLPVDDHTSEVIEGARVLLVERGSTRVESHALNAELPISMDGVAPVAALEAPGYCPRYFVFDEFLDEHREGHPQRHEVQMRRAVDLVVRVVTAEGAEPVAFRLSTHVEGSTDSRTRRIGSSLRGLFQAKLPDDLEVSDVLARRRTIARHSGSLLDVHARLRLSVSAPFDPDLVASMEQQLSTSDEVHVFTGLPLRETLTGSISDPHSFGRNRRFFAALTEGGGHLPSGALPALELRTDRPNEFVVTTLGAASLTLDAGEEGAFANWSLAPVGLPGRQADTTYAAPERRMLLFHRLVPGDYRLTGSVAWPGRSQRFEMTVSLEPEEDLVLSEFTSPGTRSVMVHPRLVVRGVPPRGAPTSLDEVFRWNARLGIDGDRLGRPAASYWVRGSRIVPVRFDGLDERSGELSFSGLGIDLGRTEDLPPVAFTAKGALDRELVLAELLVAHEPDPVRVDPDQTEAVVELVVEWGVRLDVVVRRPEGVGRHSMQVHVWRASDGLSVRQLMQIQPEDFYLGLGDDVDAFVHDEDPRIRRFAFVAPPGDYRVVVLGSDDGYHDFEAAQLVGTGTVSVGDVPAQVVVDLTRSVTVALEESDAAHDFLERRREAGDPWAHPRGWMNAHPLAGGFLQSLDDGSVGWTGLLPHTDYDCRVDGSTFRTGAPGSVLVLTPR
ncbi:hypothetical protein Pla163_03450 [Planctomycetes bacterium Pla163]|uniref:Uncharacterized protein n=1 Tax=Rohdeia mirabilis TaxID=2528008 RepID=A0A518CVI5_9BACT|nr:hypothetical protein Pla163_03450 [Planctomycetes bacterium Pla163]